MILSRLKFPIIQAPMAGGLNTPELVAEVANYGGVGSFGFAYSTPQKIEEDLTKTSALSKGVINANFFIFPKNIAAPSKELEEAAISALKELPFAKSIPIKAPSPPYYPNLHDQLEAIWKYRPEILTFHFGFPPVDVIERAKSLGIAVGLTCTSVREFLAVQDFGADFAVAQGIEAGGHRGTFVPNEIDDEELGIDELIRRILPLSRIPVVAAGGLMTGKDIARVIELGVIGVQLGTVFLTCVEAGTNSVYRNYLLNREYHGRGTTLVNTFSGRKARGISNEFITLMNRKDFLPFPLQNTLTSTIRKFATEQRNGEYQSLWAGKNYHQCEAIPTKDLLIKLDKEYNEVRSKN